MGYVYNQSTDDEGQYALGQTIDWDSFIAQYIVYLRDDKKCGKKHLYTMENSLTHAARDFEAHGVSKPAGVNQHNAKEHLNSYRDQGVADITLKHRKVQLCAIFAWGWRVEFFRKVKLEKLETPPIRDAVRHKPPTLDQIGQIVAQIKLDWSPEYAPSSRFKSSGAREFFKVRDIAVTLLLADAGLRVGECFGARLTDLNAKERMLALPKTKNGDDRVAHITEGMLGVPPDNDGEPQAMTGPFGDWVNLRLGMDCPTDYLFVTELGTKIDPGTWGKQWDRYRQRAGIERRIRRHDLRHYSSSAHDKIDRAASMVLIGHRSEATHDIYHHDDPGHLRRVHDAANPVGPILEAIAEVRKAAAEPKDKEVRRKVYTTLR